MGKCHPTPSPPPNTNLWWQKWVPIILFSTSSSIPNRWFISATFHFLVTHKIIPHVKISRFCTSNIFLEEDTYSNPLYTVLIQRFNMYFEEHMHNSHMFCLHKTFAIHIFKTFTSIWVARLDEPKQLCFHSPVLLPNILQFTYEVSLL